MLAAALLVAGCSEGHIHRVDCTRDLPPATLAVLKTNPWSYVFVEDVSALPMFYLQYGRLFTEEGIPGWRAERRGVYLSGILAQRWQDANFDARGRNLSH